MHQSETRILTNNTQTCINLEEKQEAFAYIEHAAKAHFAEMMSPMASDVWILVARTAIAGGLISVMQFDELHHVIHGTLMITFGLNVISLAYRVRAIINRVRSRIISWRDVLLHEFADYQPREKGSYYRLVANILDDGLQQDRFNAWLEVEREALNAREKDLIKGKHFSDKDEKIVKALRRRLEEG